MSLCTTLPLAYLCPPRNAFFLVDQRSSAAQQVSNSKDLHSHRRNSTKPTVDQPETQTLEFRGRLLAPGNILIKKPRAMCVSMYRRFAVCGHEDGPSTDIKQLCWKITPEFVSVGVMSCPVCPRTCPIRASYCCQKSCCAADLEAAYAAKDRALAPEEERYKRACRAGRAFEANTVFMQRVAFENNKVRQVLDRHANCGTRRTAHQQEWQNMRSYPRWARCPDR